MTANRDMSGRISERCDSGDIAPRPRDAFRQPERNGILNRKRDEGNCLRDALGCRNADRRPGDDYVGLEVDEFCG
jgi:hypothetical protein